MSPAPTPILLVDDSPSGLGALAAMLSRDDYRLVTASSGDDALRALLKEDFAVILLDVMMPGLDGFETARLVRARPASSRTPIIFLTGRADEPALVSRGYALGAVDYLVKPVDTAIVRAKVEVFVELYRNTARIREQEAQLRRLEQERAQAALRESESLFEATFAQAGTGIAHAGPDGRWLRVNQRLCDVLGVPREALVGQPLPSALHAEDRPSCAEALAALFEGGAQSWRREVRFLHPSREVVWCELSLSALRPTGETPGLVIAVVEDVTERKLASIREHFMAQASTSLLASLDLPATLDEVARHAVNTVADWCVVDLGDAHLGACSAHDGGADRVLAQWAELKQRMAYARAVGSAEPVLIAEPAGPSQQGWSSTVVAPVVARGEVLGVVALGLVQPPGRALTADLAMADDLAHRVAFAVDNARLYREAHDAVAVRDEFLSIASHELRTPLTPLLIQIQQLTSERSLQPLEYMPVERVRHLLERAERQVRRMVALTDNLLDAARAGTGRLTLEPAPVDLAELTRDVVARFSAELTTSGTVVQVRAPAPVRGRWDPLRLEQVVTNLLSNALKYGAGKPVDISVTGSAQTATFAIRDHGIGVAPDKLHRIFDRYERAVSERSYGGLGLGLYITRQIVDAHGGQIRVESPPGKGTTFTFVLPLSAQVADEAPRLDPFARAESPPP